MPSPKVDLGELIEAIYDAALSPALWQECYDGLRKLIGAESMLATFQDAERGSAALLASNLDPRFLIEYTDGWWAKDAWAMGIVSQPHGKAYLLSDIVPDAAYMGSEIYNELVRPYADCRYCVGAILDVGNDRGVMGIHRPANAPDFTQADQRLFQRFLPHIRQSLRLGQRLAEHDNARRMSQAALDSLSFGLMVVDRACRPLLMNRKAESCFRAGNGLLGGSMRMPIRTELLEQTRILHRLVHQATGPGLQSGGAMLLRRSTSPAVLTLLVSPLTGRLAAGFDVRPPAAIIFIQGMQEEMLPESNLRQLFGLTAAESRLAVLLARGMRLEDVATEQSVKMSTLRTQLRGVLSKTDTHRQSELVRLLTKLSLVTLPKL